MSSHYLQSVSKRTLAALQRFSTPRMPSHRFIATSPVCLSSQSSNFSRPSPPPLPPQQQREFKELLRRVNAPASAPAEEGEAVRYDQPEGEEVASHPDYRRKPKAEFEGDKNPRTGEVGGPKNEPLVHGDWAYGGKVTDF
ncbi:hypothetical protein JCM11251_007180 [Rhodosporidiobolus azoricus]